MQVSVETLEGLKRQIQISIPTESIDEETKSRVNELSKNVSVNGFRPGKVPVQVIRRKFGKSIHSEVVSKLIETNLEDALNEQSLVPAGRPSVEILTDIPGEPLVLKVALEVYPEIRLKDFSTLKVERPMIEITDEDVQKALEKLSTIHATWRTVERASQNGDKVEIDFEGFVDGEPLKEGKAERFPLHLGSHSMIPEFEEGLVGRKAGDEFELPVTFPEDYQQSEVAGEAAQFKVKVQCVSESTPAEINEEFVEKMGIKEGGIDGLKEEIRKNLTQQAAEAGATFLRNSVFYALSNAYQFSLPESSVLLERAYLMSQHDSNPSWEKLPEHLKNSVEEQAKKRVKLMLLCSEILKQENIELDDEQVDDRVEEMAQNYEHPEHVAAWYYDNPKQLDRIRSIVLERQLVDHLIIKMNVTDKKVTYQELIDLNKKEENDEK